MIHFKKNKHEFKVQIARLDEIDKKRNVRRRLTMLKWRRGSEEHKLKRKNDLIDNSAGIYLFKKDGSLDESKLILFISLIRSKFKTSKFRLCNLMLFRKKNRILPNEEDYKWNGVYMQAHTLYRHLTLFVSSNLALCRFTVTLSFHIILTSV